MRLVLRDPPCVVLLREAEVDVPERRVGTMQAPNDMPVLTRNLVNATRVSRGYQVVAVRILVDGVDVEVIPRGVRAQPIARSVRRGRKRITDSRMNVVQRPPLEQYFTGFNLHFLEDTLHDPSHARFDIPRTHIILPLLIDRQQGGLAVVDGPELVHVARRHPAPGLHRFDNAIPIVHDDAMPSTVPFLLVALEETEVVRTFILAHVNSMDISRARRPPAAPYQILCNE